MKHLWLLILLLVPTLGYSQNVESQYKNEGYVYPSKPKTTNPEYKFMEDLESKIHKCDPPEPIKISEYDQNNELDPDAAPFYESNGPHFNPGPILMNAPKDIVITHPDENGNICDFAAYICNDHSKSLKWTDDMLDIFEGRFERDIDREQIKQLYCLRKENCNPRE